MRSVETVSAAIRTEMLEHVMRVVDDDLPLLPFLGAEPGEPGAYEALGRLLGDVSLTLQSGTPLVVFCCGGELSDDWRERVAVAPNSLWGNLEMLETLYGRAGDTCDPYEALCALRERSEADLRS